MSSKPFKIVQNPQKEMPCNIEAEQALIGSILVSNDIYDEVSTIIDSNKFFDPIHVKIYEVIDNLIAKGLLVNPITLKNHFENNQGLKELGGQEYLKKRVSLMKKILNLKEAPKKFLILLIVQNINFQKCQKKMENCTAQ